MKKLFLLTVFLWGITSSVAQSRYFNLNVDNDLFFVTDYFYSSGIFLQYGKEILTAEKDSLRKFRLFELGQEIYTPSDRFSIDPQEYDYPYGGWTYFKISQQKEIKINKQFEVGLQLGVTGNWSLARWIQNTYHSNVLGLLKMPGWIKFQRQFTSIHLDNIFTKNNWGNTCGMLVKVMVV